MNIYTDGACRNNVKGKGDGGWACVILKPVKGQNMQEVFRDSGYVSGTTNQVMEIRAVTEAFEFLGDHNGMINLYSDSAYVINCLKDRWYDKWRENGWKNSKKKLVENREDWERLLEAAENLSVNFYHIGRNSTRYITEMDALAKDASKRETNQES
jgi:ribonuclease HI